MTQPTPREVEIERIKELLIARLLERRHYRVEPDGRIAIDSANLAAALYADGLRSQQYLDGLVAAVERLRPYPGREAEAGVTVHPSTTQRIEDFRAAVRAILRDDK